MKIILISGKAGSGKNEVALYLKKYLKSAIITSLSKYIKMFALEMTDWDGNEDSKPREFLQTMGDKLRSIDKYFLEKRMVEDFLIYKDNYDYVIISDVRLKEEINYFLEYSKDDVISIRVNCNDCRRNLTDDEKKHLTELDLDNYEKFNYVIVNNYNEELEKDVRRIVEKEIVK